MMRSPIDHAQEFTDFTEEQYRLLIQIAKRNYRFERYGSCPADRHVLWRHDLDASINRSVRLAEIEHNEGVIATYFLFPRCLFYNLLNPLTHSLICKIIDLGHDIGLHFDFTHYSTELSHAAVLDAMSAERDLLTREFGVAPTAVSFHLYGVLEQPVPEDDTVAGMVNAYSRHFRESYGYCSDSNGLWLHRRLRDVLEEAREERLQILTHPEWWTPDVMPPRARLQRAIDGYATAMGNWYDDIVARSGRPNLR